MKSNISLKDYLHDLTEIIDEYSQTGFIASSEISSDFRSQKIGLVKGEIIFSMGQFFFSKNT
jgi:hypothetical protein